MFTNFKTLEINKFVDLGKDGHRKILTNRLMKSLKLGYETNIYQKHEMECW